MFSPSLMSAAVAAAPLFVTVVLSVTLKVRELVLPSMVNVFALVSTFPTLPWNGIARAAFSVGEAAGDALAAGDAAGEGDAFFDAAKAVTGPHIAIAATTAPVMMNDFDFMFVGDTGFVFRVSD